LIGAIVALLPSAAPAIRSEWPPTYLVSEHRPEQRVVAGQDRAEALGRANLVGNPAQQGDVDQRVGRVGRRLDQNHRNPTFAARSLRGLMNGRLVDAVDEAHRADAEVCHGVREQRFRPAVQRLGMQDDVARAGEREDRGGDRRHAGREYPARLRALIDREAILDDLAVGMVEARVDEAGGAAGRRLPPP